MISKSRGAQRRRRQVFSSLIEDLEQRRLLASTLPYSGGTYTQNFDTLINTGTVGSPGNPMDLSQGQFLVSGAPAGSMQGWNGMVAPNTTPVTWNETSTAVPRFSADNGNSSTGSMFSYGNGTNTNRALGSVGSGSNASGYGIEMINSTSNIINSFTVSFTGETFRFGGSVQNTLYFGYEIGNSDSVSISDPDIGGTQTTGFTSVPSLYYSPPVQTTTNTSQLGVPALVTPISQTIAGVSWGPGQVLILRWHDYNETDNDYGIAIDNMSFSQAAASPGSISFTSATYSGQEGVNSTINFTVQRTGGAAGPALIDYTIPASGAGITATQGVDYTAPMAVAGTATTGPISGGYSGTISFLDQQTSATISVPIVADSSNEPTETFKLNLSDDASDTSGIAIGTPSSATGNIYDNNPAPPTGLLLNELDVNPPGSTDGPNEWVEIINTSGTTQSLNDVDFLSIEGDVNSNAGNITYSFPFSGSLAPGQIAILEASSGGPTPAAGSLVFTDSSVTGLNTPTGALQNGTNSFALVYSESPLNVGTDLDTNTNSSGTASNYPETGTLMLSANQALLDSVGWHDKGTGTSGDGTIYSAADLSVAGEVVGAATRIPGMNAANTASAWYYGDLFSPTGDPTSLNYDPATVGGAYPAGGHLTPGGANYTSGVTSGQIGFTASINAVNESISDPGTDDQSLVLTINRVSGSTDSVSVDYSIVGGTGAGQATAGSDYFTPTLSNGSTQTPGGYSGTIVFAAGQTSETISIPIENDSLAESSEAFTVTLSNPQDPSHPSNAPLLGPISATTVHIGDDDSHLLLTEVMSNAPFEAGDTLGSDQYNEFVEISGPAGFTIPANTYFLSVEGDGASVAGELTYVIDLGGYKVGSNGLIEIRSENAASLLPPPAPGTAVIDGDNNGAGFDQSGGILQNGTNSFLIVSSGEVLTQFSSTNPAPAGESADVDTNNDGTLDLGALGAHLVDGIGWTDGGSGDLAYGALLNFGGNSITTTGIAPAAGSRLANTSDVPDLNPNSAASLAAAGDWYYGDLVGTDSTAGTASDDRLIFANDGTAGRIDSQGFHQDPNEHLTPGELNYPTPPFVEGAAFAGGTTNPILKLDFSSNVSQNLSASQLTLTNTDTSTPVSGFSVASQTLAAAFANGYIETVNLPTGLAQGHYKLTVSSGVNDDFGLSSTSSYTVNFTVVYGDANGDGTVNALDFNILATNYGKSANYTQGDFDYSGQVGSNDFAILAANYGKVIPAATFSSPAPVADALPNSSTPASSLAASSASLFSNQPISGSLVSDLLN